MEKKQAEFDVMKHTIIMSPVNNTHVNVIDVINELAPTQSVLLEYVEYTPYVWPWEEQEPQGNRYAVLVIRLDSSPYTRFV